MYLTKVEIFGFKSFPEKTSLKFEPGITVVVGPNGCGKSNILDAVKWALGEQSPKSLRGTKMEDIIFNGTEHYPPLNYAEVILTFCNEDGYLPIDYKEVSVARRLYRSGESQYFINKNNVRLKDIQDLFMGTGIGESTYSFVEQGKIAIFLGYKPEEKRLIFDEASGIVKYKDRKRETMRRLKETDENLLRLDDIIAEVKRQVRYLERQVHKATKYKETEEELIAVEKKIATLQIEELQTKSDRVLEDLNLLVGQNQEKEIFLDGLRLQEESLIAGLDELRKKIETNNSEIVSINAGLETSASHLSVYNQRIQELQERNLSLVSIEEKIRERLDSHQQRVLAERHQLDTFQERVQQLTLSIEEMKVKKETLQALIDTAKIGINEGKVKVLELESAKVNSHNSSIESQTQLATLIKRKQRLLLDKAKLEVLLSEAEEKLKSSCLEFEETKTQLEELKKHKEQLALEGKALDSQREILRTSLVDKDKELIELKSCYEFLRDLRLKYDTFSLQKKVTVIFDEDPKDINKLIVSLKDVHFEQDASGYKAYLDAKIVSLEENQLEERIARAESEAADFKQQISDLEIKKEESAQAMLLELDQIETKQKRYHEKLQEKEQAFKETERLREEFQILEADAEAVLSEINYLEAKQKELETKLAFFEETLSATQESLRLNQERVASNSQEITIIDIETAKRQEQLQSLDKEKESLISKIQILEDERTNLLRNLEDNSQENKDNAGKIEYFQEEIEKVSAKMEEGKAKVQSFLENKTALEKDQGDLMLERQTKSKQIKEVEKESEEIKTSIYNQKLEVQSLEYEKGKVKDYLNQVYSITFEPVEKETIDCSLDVFFQNRDRLQKKKKSLGEVNLVAIEEFEELKQRDDFLNKQKEDLIASKDNLRKAILRINRTSREIFMEVFTKIVEEFKKNFRFLFNGGRAQLVLVDPDNVLDSGVEIEVQPPGKKLQNVSLLSGGEKALTAIALIFAIFQVRPSPLCVLDEIDAPLDEANVDRFNHMLKEFSAFSQFLLITHNKKTMGNANVLYGVTMQEKGVSKLVSVKFNEEEQKAKPSALTNQEVTT